jgi:hypothetical protein
LVDTQSLTQQKTISRELLSAIPTAQSALGIAALMPSVVEPPNAQDVGGSQGERSVRISIHGSKTSDARLRQNGMVYNALTPGGTFGTSGLEGTGRGYYINPLASNEVVIDSGTMGSAEYGLGGAQSNALYKDGGNRFSGAIFGGWTNHNLQSDNLTDAARAQGITASNKIQEVYDRNVVFGGPIKKDKIWFFSSFRRWGTSNRPIGLYEDANVAARKPGAAAAIWKFADDLSKPVDQMEIDKAQGFNVTVQATSKDKFQASYDRQRNFQDSLSGALNLGTIKFESVNCYCQLHAVTQFTWVHPQSSGVLFEGGMMISRFTYGNGSWGTKIDLSDESTGGRFPASNDNVSINDTGYGYSYNGNGVRSVTLTHQANGRFSASLISGAHNFKMGTQWMYGLGGGHRSASFRQPSQVNGLPVAYSFNNGIPQSLTQYRSPGLTTAQLNPDLGIFVQDQWRISPRLTASYGVRFDWVRESAPAICVAGGTITDAACYDAITNVPNWKDLTPRFGLVWDPTGSGKTGIKVGLNKYVLAASTGIASDLAPATASVPTTTRSWVDANGNFLPDCNLRTTGANGECGAMANANFGKVTPTTTADPDWVTGWGKRSFGYQFSASVDRELMQGLSVNAGYFRTWYGNFVAVDNQSVTPADYDPYCVTIPTDSRIPGSGQQLCGLYDIKPAKFGQVFNQGTFAKNYGTQHDIYNGVDATFQLRHKKMTASGGWNIGNAVQLGTTAGGAASSGTDICFVVDSPQQLFHCKALNPYQSRIKLNGSYALPWSTSLAVVFQNVPGANYSTNVVYTTAQVQQSLGRPLAGGVRTVTVNVVDPFTQYGPRITQLDLRGSKTVRLGENRRMLLNLDLYNVLNTGVVTNLFSTYGSKWMSSTSLFDGRLVKVSAQLDF